MDIEDFGIDEQFSLEEILAEYKGISYIEGDKRTPADVLDEKARRIVHEELGIEPTDAVPPRVDFEEIAAYLPVIEAKQAEMMEAGDYAPPKAVPTSVSSEKAKVAPKKSAPSKVAAPIEEEEDFSIDEEYFDFPTEPEPQPEVRDEAQIEIGDLDFTDSEPEPEPPAPQDIAPQRTIETTEAEDSDTAFFNNYAYASADPDEELIRSVSEAIERETAQTESRRMRRMTEERPRREREPLPQIDYENEPDYRERARKFAARCNSLAGRALIAVVMSIVLAVFTFIAERGGSLPFGIGHDIVAASGLLLILQAIVMIIGCDVLVYGAIDLVRGNASTETLVFVSNLVTLLMGFSGLVRKSPTLPFCAVSAISLSLALWGERLHTEALADSLRSAATINDPYSVISEYRPDLDRTMLRKEQGRFKGFYGNLTQADVSETAHRHAAPILMILAIVASVFSAVATKDYDRLPSVFASLMAAAASFTAAIAFASPFRRAARRAKAFSSAIAGPGGADDIFYTEGFCVTDEDLYPPDSLTVSNIRVLDHVALEKAVRYTASLVITSGSCLSRVFSDMLIKDGMSVIATQDFAAQEGGVSALVRGENVLVGSFAYMNLYGIRVPDELKLGNAVYTAVNGRLIAMFSVEYRPNDRVRTFLDGLLRRGMRPALTVRDFNITPMTIQQKFKLQMEEFDLLSISDIYSIGDANKGRGRTVAIYPRGSIRELYDAVTVGRKLKITSLVSTIVSIASSVIGVLIMAILGRAGTLGAARPGKLLLFMLVPLVLTIIFELIVDVVYGTSKPGK